MLVIDLKCVFELVKFENKDSIVFESEDLVGV
jgi:hypothetical protein